MIKTAIVKLLILPAVAGASWLAGGGHVPSADTTPPAVAATPAPSAQAPVGGFQVIATCDDPQDAAQGPAQARKAQDRARTVTVQVPQAVAAAPAEAPERKAAESAPQASTAAPAPSTAPSANGKVNVNTASDAELLALPGLGDGALRHIREARPIVSVDAVGKLPGVTPANFAKYRDRITV